MGDGIRVGKTTDGRYVPYDHPDSAFIAYREHDELPDEVAKQVGAKQAAKPADKQAAKPRDKARRSRSNRKPEATVTYDSKSSTGPSLHVEVPHDGNDDAA